MADLRFQDADARETIERTLDETLFVEAGAGTGKTTSLVRRVVELVSSGATTLDRLAAITFTEAAAAELRDRIREGLELAASNTDYDEERRHRCEQGVEQLDLASIQTLHSFAGALLRERPLEAGLPPAFETLDAIASDLAFEEAWARWIDAALDDAALQSPLAMAFSLGMTVANLRAIAVKFHGNYDLLADARFDAPVQDAAPQSPIVQTLLNVADKLDRLCEYSRLGDDDKLYAHTQAKLISIRQLRTQDADSPAAYRMLSRILPLRQGRGRQSDWDIDAESGENACRHLKALLQELDAEVNEALTQARSTALLGLLQALKAFVLDYAKERKRQGRAEFHDLLVWAKEMLRDNMDARDHFRRRFSHLLIDEAQDTDLIQAEIAMFLAEDTAQNAHGDAARPKDWSDITPKQGKLFVVGDPKQSIYRFRRADVRQMERLRERMGGKTLRLVRNFRSQRPVVDWVNALFGEWMAQGGAEQAEYTPIAHHRAAATGDDGKGRVWALGGVVEGDANAVRREQAADIATLLLQMQGEQWQTLDNEATAADGAERFRRANYSDICILIPTRTGLRALEQALDDAGVPYRLEGASLFFDTQEVRDLMNCLRAIDDPTDEVAIVAALRSPAFACTDIELLQFRQAGGRFNYLLPLPSRKEGRDGEAIGSEAPVVKALTTLRAAHHERLWTALAPLIDGFIRERLLMEAAMAQPRAREQWRRYRFLVEQARAFAAAGGNSLRAFLEWMQRQADEGARVTEAPVPESDEDAVRIMTVHASKGLEFPVVILTGLNTERRSRAESVIFDDGVEVGVGSAQNRFGTAGYERQVERAKAMDDYEHVRLLYVAATRARDHLVVDMHRRDRGRSDAAAIAELLDGQDALWGQVELLPPYRAQAQGIGLRGVAPVADMAQPLNDAEHTPEARKEWQARRDALLHARSLPVSVAATGLAGVVKDEAYADADADTAGTSRRGRGGAPLGRAVHAVLQTIDLATGAGIEDTARAQAAAEGIPQSQADIAALARAAVNSDIVRRAVASGRYWREALIAAPIGKGVLEGFIDLLFEEDGELVVVDYKTDAIDADATEYIANSRYRTQAGSYALITERATQKRVKDVVFLFLRPKSEQRIHDIDALKASAQRDAEQHLNG